ncbi:MAG: DUF4148 domain-containing protein [Herbaspirillum sp.]
MYTKQLIATVFMCAAAGAVMAQSPEFVAADAGFHSTKSRAEVVMELKQAQSAGLLAFTESTYPVLTVPANMHTRAEVRSQIMPSAVINDPKSNPYFG